MSVTDHPSNIAAAKKRLFENNAGVGDAFMLARDLYRLIDKIDARLKALEKR